MGAAKARACSAVPAVAAGRAACQVGVVDPIEVEGGGVEVGAALVSAAMTVILVPTVTVGVIAGFSAVNFAPQTMTPPSTPSAAKATPPNPQSGQRRAGRAAIAVAGNASIASEAPRSKSSPTFRMD